MKIVFAAALALLAATPALAGSASTLHVGLVVTGRLASPLVGTWHSRTAARGAIYHFVVSGSSGAFYKLVSISLRRASPMAPMDTRDGAAIAGTCDLRVGGVIHSLERASGPAPRAPGASYEMQYSVQSAVVVTSSTDFDRCKGVAAAYLNDTAAANGPPSLMLSSTGEGRLIDAATGVEYTRTR